MKPIVDLSAKPSRWQRLRAWGAKRIEPGEPYQPIPCDPALTRVVHMALVAITVVCLVIAWVLWGHL